MKGCLSRLLASSSSCSSILGDGGVRRRFLHGQQAAAVPPQPQAQPPIYTAKEMAEDPHFAQLGRFPSEKLIRIADEMLSLSVLEVSNVADLLKKKLKVSNVAMAGFGFAGGAGGGAPASQAAPEKKPEKMTFDVKLEKYDAAAKIKIIKEIRTFTTLGLKEAKELVEKSPAVVKTGISKEEAMAIVEKLKALGASVVME